MNYLEALFKDIEESSNKTNKIRRKAWAENTWIEEGKHHKMHRIMGAQDDWKVYEPDIEMTENDWEIYNN